jgi:triacylglycerol lipase
MSLLGLLPVRGVRAAPPPSPKLLLRVDDVLASSRRLWLRGQAEAEGPPSRRTAWWRRRNRSPRTIHVQTSISGQQLHAEVPLQPDGSFEATFEVELSATRRGWRLARTRVVLDQASADACAVVLAPPDPAAAIALVLLPSARTLADDSGHGLAASEDCRKLADELKRLQARQPVHFYYLAAVPRTGPESHAALALAINALAWPAGTPVLLPAGKESAADALARATGRIRWLFAGRDDLLLVNAEPALKERSPDWLAPLEGHAGLQPLLPAVPDHHDSPGTALAVKSSLRPTRSGRVTRYPLVFCHGMLGYTFLRLQLPQDWNCFSSLRPFLHERGFRALFPRVVPTGGVAERARQLRDHILHWTDEPVNLIAHSMGGLDCRYLISHLGMAERVKSLTTISTPHRGSWLADWFLANYRNRVPLLLALEAMGVNLKGFGDCRLEICRDFNAATPDAPSVRYFSFGGDVPHWRLSPVLRRAWTLLTPAEGPNDGMVSLQSARWGEYLGTLCADHFAQTPDGVYVRGNEDFDSLGFYTRLVEDLARRGF